MDEGNGTYYMTFRYYDPEVGRFISKDPIGFAGGDVNLYRYVDSVGKVPMETNLYQYAGNNPINFIDPLGLEKVYMAARIYFTPYFWVVSIEDTFPFQIEDLGQFYIPNAPCIFNCYFSEEEWNAGRQRGDRCEGVL
jgi:hypothetical protein